MATPAPCDIPVTPPIEAQVTGLPADFAEALTVGTTDWRRCQHKHAKGKSGHCAGVWRPVAVLLVAVVSLLLRSPSGFTVGIIIVVLMPTSFVRSIVLSRRSRRQAAEYLALPSSAAARIPLLRDHVLFDHWISQRHQPGWPDHDAP